MLIDKKYEQLILEGWLDLNRDITNQAEIDLKSLTVGTSSGGVEILVDNVVYSWLGETFAESYLRHGALIKARALWLEFIILWESGNALVAHLLSYGEKLKELTEDFEFTDDEIQR